MYHTGMGKLQILRDRLAGCLLIRTVFVYTCDDPLSWFVCSLDETGFIRPTALTGILQGWNSHPSGRVMRMNE